MPVGVEEGISMSMEICRCCAGRMTKASPRNPNLCPSCEQLLADDCADIERLLAPTVSEPHPPAPQRGGREEETAPVPPSPLHAVL